MSPHVRLKGVGGAVEASLAFLCVRMYVWTRDVRVFVHM